MPELTPHMLFLIGARWAVFVFALTVHEAAHAWMAKIGGDRTAEFEGRLSLNPVVHADPLGTVLLPLFSAIWNVPLLGWAKPVPVQDGELRHSSYMMWIALAGPLSNLLLLVWMVVVFKLSMLFSVWTGSPPVLAENDLFWYFVGINMILILFNMIPVPPLDGSRIFFHLFVRGRPQRIEWWRLVEQYGFIVLLIIIFVPALQERIFAPYVRWAWINLMSIIG